MSRSKRNNYDIKVGEHLRFKKANVYLDETAIFILAFCVFTSYCFLNLNGT